MTDRQEVLGLISATSNLFSEEHHVTKLIGLTPLRQAIKKGTIKKAIAGWMTKTFLLEKLLINKQ